jgi:DNA polymerase III subunit alpha
LMFAGTITDSQQRISKNGAPYGLFSVEDFSGNMSLMMFKEDYLKHKHMLEVANKVFIVAKVEERFHQKGNFDIRIEELYLLSEAMSKLAKSVILSLGADKVDDQLINDLAIIARENIGDCAVQVHIGDPDNGKVIKLISSGIKVEPRAFVHEIEKLKHLNYKIN